MKQKHWITTLGAGLLAFAAAAAPLAAKPQPTKESKPEESAPLISGPQDLGRLDRQLVELARKAEPATVSLTSIGGKGAGSGVVVSPDGIILTAGHVLAAMSDDIIVLFPDGTRAKAKPLGADFDRDAGMVKITDPGTWPYVEMAEGKPLRVNDWCIAMGHPGGFDPMRTPPLRLGRVIHAGDFLITDCAVVGGDSGGPLFDTEGRVVGIHSNIGMTLTQNRHVPIAVYRDEWKDLLAGKRVGKRFASVPGMPKEKIDPDRVVLGVQLEKADKKGVVVGEVVKDSPAAKAGLKPGDVIVKAAGKKVTSVEQLRKLISERKAGAKIGLKIRRDGKMKRVKATLVRLGDLIGETKKPQDAKKPKAKAKKPAAKSEKSAKKSEAKPEAKKPDPDAAIDEFLDKALKGAKDGQLKLELTPEQIEKFGGMQHFMERVKERLAAQASGKMDKKAPEKSAPKPAAKKPEKKAAKKPEAKPEKCPKCGKPHPKKPAPAAKAKAKPAPTAGKNKPKKQSTDAELDAYLDKMLKGMKSGKLELELTPEQIKKFGGMSHLQKRLEAKLKNLKPEELMELMKNSGGAFSMGPDKFFESSLKALEPVTKKSAGSVVAVLADGKPAALGTVVDAKGRILTKDTETRKGEITVQVGKDTRPAKLIRRFPAYDLAIFEVSPKGLHPVRWFKAPKGAPLGSLLTAPDAQAEPLGIGVLSVKSRPLGSIGFLGVQGGEAENGVLVAEVVKNSAAAKAGLKKGDVIVAVDGKSVEDGVALARAIGTRKAGQTVALGFLRNGKKQTVKAKLMPRPARVMPERFRKMNRMSGPLSEKQGGFPEALQHDIPLEPAQCGGPLLDLQGRCIGINVSRAGRVKTYAIPAASVAKLIAQARKAPTKPAKAQKHPAKPSLAAQQKKVQAISEIKESIEQIQHNIERIEQRLKKLENQK